MVRKRSGKHKTITPITFNAVLMFLIALLLVPAQVAGSCEASDYRQMVGHTGSAVTYNSMFVVPNTAEDLFIAGSYTENNSATDNKPYLYSYLFQERTCQILWKYASQTFDSPLAVLWSKDEQRAYMLAHKEPLSKEKSEFLIVFTDPYARNSPNTASPKVYNITNPQADPVIKNGGGFFFMPSSGRDEYLLVLRAQSMSVLRVGPHYAYAYSSQKYTGFELLHAAYSAESRAAYLLQGNWGSEASSIALTKVNPSSIAKATSNNGFDFSVFSPEIPENDNKVGGRIGVHYTSSIPGVETIFFAISTTDDFSDNRRRRVLQDEEEEAEEEEDVAYSGTVDFVKVTFKDNVADCGDSGNCVRFAYNKWAKVLALSPQSSSESYILIHDATRIILVSVNFATGSYSEWIQEPNYDNFYFDVYAFTTGLYDEVDLFATPFYNSAGIFQDFYLAIAVNSIDGMITSLIDPSKRQSDFFAASTVEQVSASNQVSLTISVKSESSLTFSMGRSNIDLMDASTSFVPFNGIVDQDVQIVDYMSYKRQVFLNNAPIITPKKSFKFEYGVGQFFWTSFPDVTDEERMYTQTRFDVIAYDYVLSAGKESKLPPAKDFFTLQAGSNYIRSAVFLEEHIGTHKLNVTIADSYGAQSSFELNFKVNETALIKNPIIDPYAQIPLGTGEALADEAEEDSWYDEEYYDEEYYEEEYDGEEGEYYGEYGEYEDYYGEYGDDYGGEYGDDYGEYGDYYGEYGDYYGEYDDYYYDGEYYDGEYYDDYYDEYYDDEYYDDYYDDDDDWEDDDDSWYDEEAEDSKEDSEEDVEASESFDFDDFSPSDFVFDPSKFKSSSGCTSIDGCDGQGIAEETALSVERVRVSMEGQVNIRFNSKITFLIQTLNTMKDGLKQNKKQLRSLQKLLGKQSRKSKRKLANSDKNDEKLLTLLINQFVAIEVIDDGDSGQSTPEFEYELFSMDSYNMILAMVWSDPSSISKNGEEMQMKISFNTNMLGEAYSYDQPAPVEFTVPPQISAGEAVQLEEAKEQAAAVKNVAQAAVAGFQIARFMLVGALSQLWGMVNGLSMFIHLPLVGVVIPVTTLAFFSIFIEIAQFDIIDNSVVFGGIFTWVEEDESLLDQRYVDCEYGSNFSFDNMGTNVLVLTTFFLIMISLLFTSYCRASKNRIGRYHRYCSKGLFWNDWIRMFLQGILQIGIGAYMYISNRGDLLKQSSEGYTPYFFVNDVLAYGQMAVLAILPVWTLVFYCRKFEKLGDKDFNETYGSAYEGLRTDRRSSIFFPVFFIIRRYVFVILAFWFVEYQTFFIIALLEMTMIELGYLIIFKPFDDDLAQGLEIFNEVTSLVLIQATLCLTKFVWQEDTRTNIGWFFVSLMTFNMMTHIYFMIRSSCRDCCKKCKNKKAIKKSKDKQEGVLSDSQPESRRPRIPERKIPKELEMSKIQEADNESEDESGGEDKAEDEIVDNQLIVVPRPRGPVVMRTYAVDLDGDAQPEKVLSTHFYSDRTRNNLEIRSQTRNVALTEDDDNQLIDQQHNNTQLINTVASGRQPALGLQKNKIMKSRAGISANSYKTTKSLIRLNKNIQLSMDQEATFRPTTSEQWQHDELQASSRSQLDSSRPLGSASQQDDDGKCKNPELASYMSNVLDQYKLNSQTYVKKQKR